MSARENQYAGHRCRCVILSTSEANFRNHCNVLVPSPDQPYCDDCASRHPELPQRQYASHVPLPRQGV